MSTSLGSKLVLYVLCRRGVKQAGACSRGKAWGCGAGKTDGAWQTLQRGVKCGSQQGQQAGQGRRGREGGSNYLCTTVGLLHVSPSHSHCCLNYGYPHHWYHATCIAAATTTATAATTTTAATKNSTPALPLPVVCHLLGSGN